MCLQSCSSIYTWDHMEMFMGGSSVFQTTYALLFTSTPFWYCLKSNKFKTFSHPIERTQFLKLSKENACVFICLWVYACAIPFNSLWAAIKRKMWLKITELPLPFEEVNYAV